MRKRDSSIKTQCEAGFDGGTYASNRVSGGLEGRAKGSSGSKKSGGVEGCV